VAEANKWLTGTSGRPELDRSHFLVIFCALSRSTAALPEYQFYRVDEHCYLLPYPEVADRPEDNEAVAHAKQILTGYVIEVRQGIRIVMRIEPEI
jgi:hypothetical protein